MKTAPCAALVALIALLPSSLVSQTWDGSESNLWNAANNWSSPVNVPNTAGATAVFPVAANQNIDLGGGTFSVGTLNFNGATDYSISNGTLNLNSSFGRGATGTATIGASIVLGNSTITSTLSGGNFFLNGSISGAGSSSAINLNNGGSGIVRLSGDNTFAGGFTLRSGVLEAGSNTAFGTGLLTLGLNNSGDGPFLRSSSTSARVFSNNISLNAPTINFGDATNNGKLTFGTASINKTVTDSSIQIRTRSDVEFTGGIQAGASDGTVRINSLALTTPVLTLASTSNRTGVTEIGNTSAEYGTVRVTANNALGTGDVLLASNRGRLQLQGGVSMTNNVSIFWSSETGQFITSLSGNNTISGSVKINNTTGASISQIGVTQDTLTLSGGVTGFTTVSTNFLQKNLSGTLALTGATDSGVRGFFINDGALRVNSSSLTTGQSVEFLGTGSTAPVLETSGTYSRTLGNSAGQGRWTTGSNGGFAAHGGTLNVQLNGGTGTMIWGSTSGFVGAGSMVLNSATANNLVDFQNGLNLNAATRTINVLDNVNSTADVARISGVVSGTGASVLNKTGAGVLELTGNNTYVGGTTVAAGTLLINNIAGSGTGSGAVSVASGAAIGGDGTISGNLTLAAGALFAFDTGFTLDLTGTLSLDSSFGVASLRSTSGGAVDWGLVADGTYTLMNTSFVFNETNISNFGAANAFDLGGGRSAYFENGSLALVVVPEPGAAWLFLTAGGLLWMIRRRRVVVR